METFRETKKASSFDWNDFLNQETITRNEWCLASDLAASWVTCACGNLCNKIPRVQGVPVDLELRYLGTSFNLLIGLQLRDAAKEILQKIETRSAEILQELNKNQS